jgi:hypothetical protein
MHIERKDVQVYFLTSMLDGGQRLDSRFTEGKDTSVHTVQEAGRSDDIGGHLHQTKSLAPVRKFHLQKGILSTAMWQ